MKTTKTAESYEEAMAMAAIHAAQTGEVVVANMGPDGAWTLTSIDEPAPSCPADADVEDPPRTSWAVRLWRRVTRSKRGVS